MRRRSAGRTIAARAARARSSRLDYRRRPLPMTLSTLQIPAPRVAIYSQAKQNSTARSPMLLFGRPPFGWWIMKYATAISPLARNAAGLVNRPIMIRKPQTVSMNLRPADQRQRRHRLASEQSELLQPVYEEDEAEHDPHEGVRLGRIPFWNHRLSLQSLSGDVNVPGLYLKGGDVRAAAMSLLHGQTWKIRPRVGHRACRVGQSSRVCHQISSADYADFADWNLWGCTCAARLRRSTTLARSTVRASCAHRRPAGWRSRAA